MKLFFGFVATGALAGDDRWAQLAFREIIGGLNAIVIQKGKEMIALFVESFADGFFAGFAAGRLQQMNSFVFEGLTQISGQCQGSWTKVHTDGICLARCIRLTRVEPPDRWLFFYQNLLILTPEF